MMQDARRRFPWWIPLGALVLALGYLPTLHAPFDFIDDGNLVYPAPEGTTLAGHVQLWWQKVQANYEHLGPFRPTLWLHWEIVANTSNGDALSWRAWRMTWCAFAAGMLLWWFREMGIPPLAAFVAGALAMLNPYRNEIWTSLTLGEGVAMPYALLGLVAARKGADARHPWIWDALALFGTLMALGCKNTFVAIIPAQVLLRMWPDGVTWREGFRQQGWRALVLTLPVIPVLAHYAYFKLNWQPGQYETHPPTLTQAGRILNAWKGAIGLDFAGASLGWVLAVVCWARGRGELLAFAREHQRSVAVIALLLAAGLVVYLPMSSMSGRYTMSGVWGLDLGIALLLTALYGVSRVSLRRITWASVGIGLILVAIASYGRQEKIAARSRVLHAAMEYVEATAPLGARLAWISGERDEGQLNVEEGIHFQWHLYHRGRGDLRIGLFDEKGEAVSRVELPLLDGPADFRVSAFPADEPGWGEPQWFRESYRLGKKEHACQVQERVAPVSASP